MKFPSTNKHHQSLEAEFGENAKVLEDLLTRINKPLFFKWFFIVLGLVCISLFFIIVVIRLATHIF